eukprot:jgi/Psemu1/236028/estExt_Genewise1.C_380117
MDPDLDVSRIATLERVPVPSTIEVLVDPEHGYLPGYMGHRGVAVFRTAFVTPLAASRGNGDGNGNGNGGRLQLQACSFYCRVWVNGIEVGDHTAGGYVAWWLDVPPSVLKRGQRMSQRQRYRQRQRTKQRMPPLPSSHGTAADTDTHTDDGPDPTASVLRHELVVLVDNRFNATTAPMHTGGDFWHYGGILRSVEWHDRPPPLPRQRSRRSVFSERDTYPRNQNGGLAEGKGFGTKRGTRSRRTDSAPSRFGDSVGAYEDDYDNEEEEEKETDDGDDDDNVWPWRLYVYPQKDLRTVRLILQVAGTTGTESTNNSELLRALIRSRRIAVYFDGDASRNALAEGDTACADSGESSAGVLEWTALRTDRLLELGRCFLVPDPRIWSTTDPQLHTVSVELNGAILTERFGLRYWDVEETTSRIRLNGEVLKLVGWNHHTQWPYTAASPTDEQLDADMALLTDSGRANFVRGAHYPQDPRWLDRLDEHGVVMWCETLGPGVSVANLRDNFFLEQQDIQLNEMMENAFNHASIAFWAFFNEGPSHLEEACKGYQASSDAIRNRDPTRFITYASNHPPPSDKCYEAATVISHNSYPGWYHPDPPGAFWNRVANDLRAGNPPSALGKAFLISETGAGGIYEWHHNDTSAKWTLRYQTETIVEDVDTAIGNPNISGIALWHFFDFKVDDEWENNTHCDYLPDVKPATCGYIDADSNRPGGANHKGSVDFFRRPKPAFSVVASKYKNVTMPEDFDVSIS